MNDNRDEARGVEIHRIAYFLDQTLFDFYSFLPDFRAVEVCDRRLVHGTDRRLTIQITDKGHFLRVTQYCFRRT